ncbi:MAG: histidine kinase dimerization/phospho-acceptor domain-containing protein [Anaerolineae bacterium]
MRFFERWLACDSDGDGFPEWQSEGQTGYPFMPSFALGLPWGQNAEIRYFETPDLLAYLLSEAISLREIATRPRRDADEQRLKGTADGLAAKLELMWNPGEKRYAYRDRDTHLTTGSVSVLQDGRGDADHILALKLDPPNRLIVEVTGGTNPAPKMKLHLSGIDASGNRVQEDAEAFVWTASRGVYTSRHALSQVDRIRVEGIASVYRVSARTMRTNGFDLNGLLPLWSVGIAPERADALIAHLTNPDEFWRKNGVLMFSAQDPHYNPALAQGSVGVWAYWLTLIGEGLIEHNRVDLATELIKRLLAAQTDVPRTSKAFYEFYLADEARGMGERGKHAGLSPAAPAPARAGRAHHLENSRLDGRRVRLGRSRHGDAARRMRRSAEGTEICFPSGSTVQLAADAPLARSHVLMTDALAFIYSQSSDGILIADAAGQIEQVNPAAAAMLDTSAENLIGGAARDCFGKNPALASLFAQPDEITIDVPLPRRRTASGTAATLDDGRRIVLLHDVTEQRDLDARREAFVMTMAHDLRNPIAALIGYAELINTVGELNPEQELFLSRVRDTARRLHDLAAELVDLAWVEAGMPLRRDPVALGRLIESVIVELTPMAQAKGVTSAWRCSSRWRR